MSALVFGIQCFSNKVEEIDIIRSESCEMGPNSKTDNREGLYGRRESGFAILILLVAVAILMLLYFVDISAVFGPSRGGTKRVAVERPWFEEDRIVAADAEVKLSRRPKPLVDEPVEIRAAVSRDGQDRGELLIEFDVDGRVRCEWSCEYAHGDRAYSYSAESAGNIDAKKKFVKDGTADKSQLYFITKGGYERVTAGAGNVEGPAVEKGVFYVTGWLSPDHLAVGKITITTDRTWLGVYEYSGTP